MVCVHLRVLIWEVFWVSQIFYLNNLNISDENLLIIALENTICAQKITPHVLYIHSYIINIE